MGNCICVTHKTKMSWSVEAYCGSFHKRSSRRRRRSTVFDDEDNYGEKLLGETSSVTSSSSSSSCEKREIKIRMTKKELEDLMRDIGLKSLTAEEILSTLLFEGGDQIGDPSVNISNHQRPWKPALQSIPEMD